MDAVIVAAHCSRIRRERSGLVTGFELITIFRLNHGVGLVVTAERGELLWAHDFLHTGERCKAHDSLLSELTVCTIGQIKISHTVAAVQIDAIAAEMFIFVGHKPHIGKQHVAVDCPCNVLLTVVTSGDECNVLVAARITVVHQAAKKCIIAAQITVNLLTVDAVAVLCIVKTVNVKQRNVKIQADNIVFKAAHHQIIQIRLCTEKPRLCKAFRFQHSAHGKAGRTVTADDIDLTHEILRIPDARFCGGHLWNRIRHFRTTAHRPRHGQNSLAAFARVIPNCLAFDVRGIEVPAGFFGIGVKDVVVDDAVCVRRAASSNACVAGKRQRWIDRVYVGTVCPFGDNF